MEDLTPRQIEILKAIITEYTETGEAVGSDILDKKFNLGVSPATIRNEMVELAKKNYLKKSYFSSGRLPTSQAFRFYISNLMNEKELSTAEEVAYKSAIWDFRSELHQLLQHATQSLAHKTGMLAVATTSKGDVYYFGVKNALSNKEFWDIDHAQSIFERFDGLTYWTQILEEFKKFEDEILFMFADDEPIWDNIASVFGEFEGPGLKGAIGVIGPRRMRYEVIVPTVRYCTNLIEDIVQKS
ncbi:hypothetical protein A3D06_01335 [Candidatus Roizmanbacteria bacterium RIFCSPHIGHO2_02_FULL_40_9]|uniref:Heat-inducible transcription repressor HrcA C-terminal domain-containing protein n=2 Tax=Candidatus Roizmaniibacteriota TaxID=1752723 RepID=A0A1F7IK08_9BACT|nr:MAG: hypothetical protein A3D06_01335 [Candidatus Roizmanbacteria bacterium RIFCSPHIGHO2_02_FULL_40_9]OGK43685.1 MAG: hypothetical protein A2957_02965 [Candidatus Roizmanbacteria bacterium RIFCSPLOWO2_01_FULL_38_11]